MFDNVIRIWKNKGQILEGITNSVFRKEDVEAIAEERLKVCLSDECGRLDLDGDACAVPATQPCCAECGCSLKFKTRALSASCPLGYWNEELTEEEEAVLNQKLGIAD